MILAVLFALIAPTVSHQIQVHVGPWCCLTLDFHLGQSFPDQESEMIEYGPECSLEPRGAQYPRATVSTTGCRHVYSGDGRLTIQAQAHTFKLDLESTPQNPTLVLVMTTLS